MVRKSKVKGYIGIFSDVRRSKVTVLIGQRSMVLQPKIKGQEVQSVWIKGQGSHGQKSNVKDYRIRGQSPGSWDQRSWPSEVKHFGIEGQRSGGQRFIGLKIKVMGSKAQNVRRSKATGGKCQKPHVMGQKVKGHQVRGHENKDHGVKCQEVRGQRVRHQR